MRSAAGPIEYLSLCRLSCRRAHNNGVSNCRAAIAIDCGLEVRIYVGELSSFVVVSRGLCNRKLRVADRKREAQRFSLVKTQMTWLRCSRKVRGHAAFMPNMHNLSFIFPVGSGQEMAKRGWLGTPILFAGEVFVLTWHINSPLTQPTVPDGSSTNSVDLF